MTFRAYHFVYKLNYCFQEAFAKSYWFLFESRECDRGIEHFIFAICFAKCTFISEGNYIHVIPSILYCCMLMWVFKKSSII